MNFKYCSTVVLVGVHIINPSFEHFDFPSPWDVLCLVWLKLVKRFKTILVCV